MLTISMSGLDLLAENSDQTLKRRPEQIPAILESFREADFYFSEMTHALLQGRGVIAVR